MERKNTLLLTVIAVATLLVAVVGATFAYFASTYTQSGNDQTVNVTTKKVTNVTYTTGSTFIADNNLDLPSGTAGTYVFVDSMEFDVSAAGSTYDTDTVSYDIYMTNITNGFAAEAITKPTGDSHTISGTTAGATTTTVNASVVCRLFRSTDNVNWTLVQDTNCDGTADTKLNTATKETFAVNTEAGTSPETYNGRLYHKVEVLVWNDTAVDNDAQGINYTGKLAIRDLNTTDNSR